MTVSDFDKNLNIGYIDENLEKPSIRLIFKHWYCSIIVYSIIYFLFCFNPNFLLRVNEQMKHAYEIFLMAYSVISPIIFLIFRPKSIHNSHSIHVIEYFKRIIKKFLFEKNIANPNCQGVLNVFIPTYQEKQAIMLFFIKVFFGTLMVRGLFENIHVLDKNADIFFNIILKNSLHLDYKNFQDFLMIHHKFFFDVFILILFTIDLGVFVFGYLTEATFFKNKIRTVDTNIVSIIFCLACYIPFNLVTVSFVGERPNDGILFFDGGLTTFGWVYRFITLFFIIIYVWASVALGTKASNLTNRGTVCKFPYNIIRHPAYISKNIFWILYTIPIFFTDFKNPNFALIPYLKDIALATCSCIATTIIYYFRAICEEKHLMQDPDYQEYAKKVKYRFIPFIY